jgi:hypothetical protein
MNRFILFILVAVMLLAWACSQPKGAVKEIRSTGPVKTERASMEEQAFIDGLIIRKVELLKAQVKAVEASDSGQAADASRLAAIENDLSALEREIAAYLTNAARRDYYHEALDMALRGL